MELPPSPIFVACKKMVLKSWNYEWNFENFRKFFKKNSFFACQDLLDEFAPPPFKNDATCLEITHFFIPLFNKQSKLTNITDPDKYNYMYQK